DVGVVVGRLTAAVEQHRDGAADRKQEAGQGHGFSVTGRGRWMGGGGAGGGSWAFGGCRRRGWRARCSRIATAGSVLPSRNSRKAPPAVEMYEILSATPNLLIAAIGSPPPRLGK